MRVVYDTNGNNVTSSVLSALRASRALTCYDTFWFQYFDLVLADTSHPHNLFYTSAPFPISTAQLNVFPSGPSKLQTANFVLGVPVFTFLPAKIERTAFTYEIGFAANTVDVTIYWNDANQLPNRTGFALPFGLKYALARGFLDEMPVWIHRAIYSDAPSRGGTLLGTTLMWRGFVRTSAIDRGKAVVTLASLMDIFQDLPVPTQVIEPGNRLAPYTPAGQFGTLHVSGGIGSPMDLQYVVSGSTNLVADHALVDAYIVAGEYFQYVGGNQGVGNATPTFFRIRDNVTTGGTLHIYPYEPINPIQMAGQTFTYYYLQKTLQNSGGSAGFPSVPRPETAL